jgi:predicted PurR-regulated permease PerM
MMTDSSAPGNPPVWSRTTRIIVLVVVLLGAAALIFLAWPMFQALVIAGLLAYLLEPLVNFIVRRFGWRRHVAAVVVYGLLLLIIMAIPALVGTLVINWFSELNTQVTAALDELKTWLSQPFVIVGIDLSPRLLLESLGRSAGSAVTSLSGSSLKINSSLTTNILVVLAALVSMFYLMRDGPQLKPWFVGLFLPEYRSEVSRLIDEIDEVWRLFLRVQIIIFIVLAILMLIGAGLVIWLYQLGLIPFSTLGLIGMLIIVYALVQQVDNLWLRPQMLGHQLKLHPGVVFVALIVGLAVGNLVGAILAVPLLATVKVLWHYVQHKMAGLDPWQSPAQPVANQDQPTEEYR